MASDDQPIMATENAANEGTKVFYYVDDEKTPYIAKFAKSTAITLAEFKAVLIVPHSKYKFFFETVDKDIKRFG